MALKVLEGGPSFQHSFIHDLESIFHVIVWMCTLRFGPCDSLRQLRSSSFQDLAIAKWNGNNGEATMAQACDSKCQAMRNSKETFERTILEKFPTYFTPLTDCMHQLRYALFPVEDSAGARKTLLFYKSELADLLSKTPMDAEDLAQTAHHIPIERRDDGDLFSIMLAVLKSKLDTLPAKEDLPAIPAISTGTARRRQLEPCRPMDLSSVKKEPISDISNKRKATAYNRLAKSEGYRSLSTRDSDEAKTGTHGSSESKTKQDLNGPSSSKRQKVTDNGIPARHFYGPRKPKFGSFQESSSSTKSTPTGSIFSDTRSKCSTLPSAGPPSGAHSIGQQTRSHGQSSVNDALKEERGENQE